MRNGTSVQIPEDREHCFRQIGTARQSRGRFLRSSVLIPVKMNADSRHREHQFSGFLFTMPGIRRRNQINEVLSFFVITHDILIVYVILLTNYDESF